MKKKVFRLCYFCVFIDYLIKTVFLVFAFVFEKSLQDSCKRILKWKFLLKNEKILDHFEVFLENIQY